MTAQRANAVNEWQEQNKKIVLFFYPKKKTLVICIANKDKSEKYLK